MRFLVVAVSLLLSWPVLAQDWQQLRGPAQVHDGDTITVSGVRVRLLGIDAPELKQQCQRADGSPWHCGIAAREKLRQLAEGEVLCRWRETDHYQRVIGRCERGGVDLNGEMVRAGIALAYRKYSTDYVQQESAAKRAHRGMWQGKFIRPWRWRHYF